jgi:hypothetical protein
MGMILDGIAASEAVDSSGEILLVEGADISDLEEGRGTLNWEHRGEDAPGASANDHIGRIVYAKKVFKRGDCEDDRQREYWDHVKLPFIYIRSELFDGEGHPGATAAAAMVRHYQKRGIPILIRYSIEGSTLEREGNVLKQTIARRVAATIKPANKSCISGVVKDGQEPTKEKAPEDPLAAILADDAKKFEAPDRMKLGGAVTIACNPEFTVTVESQVAQAAQRLQNVAKAIDAGSYNAAPGTLTGGAALQVEDIGRRAKVLATCKAALRDYDPHAHGPFRKYLADQLPEASEEFLDRFEELAGEWAVKKGERGLGKDEKGVESGPANADASFDFGANAAAPKPPPPPKQKKPTAFELSLPGHKKDIKKLRDRHADPTLTDEQRAALPHIPPSEQFKMRARKVGRGESYFDEGTGTLYTHKGEKDLALKLYIPNEDHYHQVLHDPEINRIHDHAVKNWMSLHKLVRSGQLPPEVIAHAALFSAMSPRTPVPEQELAYGFMQDFVDQGWDPTKDMGDKYAPFKDEWDRIVMSGDRLPAYMNDHYSRPEVKALTTVADGRRQIISLGNDKFESASRYNEMHDAVARLAREHGADGRAISERLSAMKDEAGKWQNRANTARKKGQSIEPLQTPAVYGFAPKTIRYLLGMAGYGNVMVPDTHFIRHSFGFKPEDPHNDVVKDVMTDAKYEKSVNQGVDRYYYAHHPAVAHARKKIQEQYGEDIGEHALFPGFWLHWLTVGSHDRARNWDTSQISNEGTDHAVYWNAVQRVLQKYNIPWTDHRLHKAEDEKSDLWERGGSMPARTAHAMHELTEQFGHTPAMFAFHAFMLPALLSHSKHPLLKALRLADELRKAAGVKDIPVKAEHQVHESSTRPSVVKLGTKHIIPGEIEVMTGTSGRKRLPLIRANQGGFHIVRAPQGDEYGLFRIPARGDHVIHSMPQVVRGGSVVDSVAHGLPHLSTLPEQVDLLQGMNLLKPIPVKGDQDSRQGQSAGEDPDGTGWRQSAAGQVGYVKPSAPMTNLVAKLGEKEFTSAHREAAFYRLAKDFFGLGHHVPVTAAFKHPMTGEPHSVSKQVKGGEHHEGSGEHDGILTHLGETGTLDKLALMDMVLNSNDRHRMNYMLTPSQAPFIHLIDNGLSFAPPGEDFVTDVPHYWLQYNHDMHGEDEWHHEPLHPEAAEWVKKLDPAKLDEHMEKLGVPGAPRKEAVRRLTSVRNRVLRGDVTKGGAFFSPFINPRRVAPPTEMVEDHSLKV